MSGPIPAALAPAYAACQRLARAHAENFPVASSLLPRELRPHVAAIYAFARIADDFADEPGREPAERLALLDEWRRLLHRAASAHSAPAAPAHPAPDALEAPEAPEAPEALAHPAPAHPAPAHSAPVAPAHPSPRHAAPEASASARAGIHRELRRDLAEAAYGREGGPAVFAALSHTMAAYALPVDLFDDLLSAFRQDVVTTRYETWADVMDYCRRSANPVGRLVLRLFGYNSPTLDAQSDAVCTALQLTNFWQDLAIDWRRGRLYVPAEEWRAAGADPASLDRGEVSAEWQAALSRAASRTRGLFDAGRGVCDGVAGRLRYELRATWLGGVRILDRVERVDFDVFRHRPSLNAADALVIAWCVLRWRATHPSITPS